MSAHATHRHTSHEHEHDFEVEPGLPQPLPAGERVLWKGGPDWRVLARECFHIRKLALYFSVLVVWRVWTVLSDGSMTAAIVPTLTAVGLALTALGIVALIAWLSARTTVYTITDRRIVMRVGIVLSVTFNLPFKRIEAADLRPLASGHGDIALSLDDSTRIAYLHLWPHARPWRVARVQPSLRALPDAPEIARRLTHAWKTLRADQASGVIATRPVHAAPQVHALPSASFSPRAIVQTRPSAASSNHAVRGDRHVGAAEAA